MARNRHVAKFDLPPTGKTRKARGAAKRRQETGLACLLNRVNWGFSALRSEAEPGRQSTDVQRGETWSWLNADAAGLEEGQYT